MLTSLGALFRWAGELLGIVKKNQDLKNTPAMQKADQAKKDAEHGDKIDKILEKEDVKATQKELSNS